MKNLQLSLHLEREVQSQHGVAYALLRVTATKFAIIKRQVTYYDRRRQFQYGVWEFAEAKKYSEIKAIDRLLAYKQGKAVPEPAKDAA